MKFGYISLIVLLVVVLLILSNFWFLTNSYTPYYSNSIFRKEYPYEPFSTLPTISSSLSTPSVPVAPPAAKPTTDNSLFQGADFNAPEKPLDLFSQLKSSPECVGSSAGLYNSTGGLCLSSDAMKALKTRGGNQSLPIM